MKRQWKRTLSIILSVAMLFSMTGMNTVFATEGGPTIGASGPCEHHKEHTADCGYTEGTPEVLCAHDHTDECYQEVTDCTHTHTDECYPAEDSVSDNDATPSDAEQREPTECTHMCSEESGCVTEELDCQHEHDEDCGYIPAVAGTPCTFVCEECEKDSGEQNPPPAKDELVQIITGFAGFDGFAPLDTIEVTEKSTVAAIGLPETLNVAIGGVDGETAIPVTWETADGSDYENTEFETYDFVPVWDAEVYELAEGLTDWDVPYITVNIAGMENPNTKDVTTAAELKTVLEATDAATINVTADIELDKATEVGADHTLHIADGTAVSVGGHRLTIPEGKTLALSGPGTLEANSKGNQDGIYVEGTLKLATGSKLVADSSEDYTDGVILGLSPTPGTLVSEGGHITVLNSGNNSSGITGGSGTGNDAVILSGGSLTVQNTAGYGVNGVNLTITDGCAVSIANTGTNSTGLYLDELSVTGSTVSIANTVGTGLGVETLTVEDSTVTVANSAGMGIKIDLYGGEGILNLKNSTLALENTSGGGLAIGSADKLMIDGSTVTVEAKGGTGLSRQIDAYVVGTNGGKLTLMEGAKLGSAGNIFSDRGSVYGYGGLVTVVAENGPASTDKLTAGDYIWNGTVFLKGATSGTVTGSLQIGGNDVVSDLTQDGSGTTSGGVGWAWNAAATTLTLTGNGSIGGATDSIVFEATGDITVAVNGTVSASVLQHSYDNAGTLTLTGSGTLTLANEWLSSHALWARAGLKISGLTVSASTTKGNSYPVHVDSGSLAMTDGKLTAAATGANAFGIWISENIAISGTAEVTASGGNYGLLADGDINISGGTVEAVSTGDKEGISTGGALDISGGSVTAKSTTGYLAIDATGGITVGNATLVTGENGNNGSITVNLTVNDAGANVTVNGHISQTYSVTDSGNLTVSAGTVQVTGNVVGNATVSGGTITVDGTVHGLTNHTGGTLNGKNPPTQITFTAEQTGGTSGTADSTGIVLTFSQDVTGLTKSAIKFPGGTGVAFIDGDPTGSGKVWTVPIHVDTEGTVTITIDQFGDFGVTNNPQTVTVYKGGGSAPTVTDVTVNPATANVRKGTTRQFSAIVSGTGAFDDTVTWNVTGGGAGTSIATNGLLTVAAGETAQTLTVKAASTADSTKFATGIVTVTDTPVTTYALTVTNGTGGGSYEAGTTVTLTANAPAAGKVFDKWVLTSGGGTLANANSATTTYTMPGNAATVTATYKDAPIGSHTITASAGTGGSISPSGSVAVSTGESKTFTISANSNYSISSVLVDGVNQGAISSYTFNNVTGDHTISATFSYNGGGSSGGGGGGSSSGGSTTTPTVTPPDPGKPNTAINAETKVTPTVNANGSATVTVPDKSVTDAIKAAQDAAKKAGTEKNGISVTINATTGKGASDITATLTEQSVDALIKAGVTEVRIKGDAVTITLDLAALKAAQAVAGGAITVSAKPVAVNTLSAEAQKAIGNRPVFQLTLTSGGKAVTNFGGGSVSVAIPYTLGANEKAGNAQAVYVDGSGKVTWLTNSSYDTNAKALLFSTGHFSVFGVGYKADAPVFTDTENHWAKADIDFVAARGLFSGTGNNQFSPDIGMTRGMFVTALGRLDGIDPAGYKTVKFTDVKADAYYAPYVNWAAEKGIVIGTTATTFAPDTNISREQMSVIMQNYAKAMGYTVPKTREAVTFADNGSIGSWAKDAVKAMQMAGVINGKDGNRFDPTGTATRAEVAAVLHRYVELVIDPATAQGWTQNDAGQWLYYENGKPVTGWKQINGKWYYLDTAGIMQSGGWKQIGGKWYYLYADGSMAVNTKIDGYEVGPDGAWKEK